MIGGTVYFTIDAPYGYNNATVIAELNFTNSGSWGPDGVTPEGVYAANLQNLNGVSGMHRVYMYSWQDLNDTELDFFGFN